MRHLSIPGVGGLMPSIELAEVWDGGGVIVLVSAPTNLGLRPPEPGGVPGTAKAPEALREAGLHRRLGAVGALDGGVVLPGRYVDDDPVRPPGRIRNQAAIIDHARRLGDRLGTVLAAGGSPLVLGGDCSLVLAAGWGLRGRGAGLVHLDGHSDFRHPGNSTDYGSLAGEDLAAAIGRHLPSIAELGGGRPLFAARRTVHLGCRDEDEHRAEATAALAAVMPAAEIVDDPVRAGARAVEITGPGAWLQVDVDVLDPRWMPAVDSPAPGGLSPDQLVALLSAMAPSLVGAAVTVFDPDLDPDGRYARLLSDIVVAGLGGLGRAAAD